MKVTKLKIPMYDFDLTFIEIESPKDEHDASKYLNEIKMPKEDANNIKRQIREGATNGGDTWRNFPLKKILMIAFKCESERKRRNIINHEKRHVVDRIMEWASIHDIETSAFLDGYISEFIY